MKRLVSIILTLALCCGLSLIARNRALIIGIGHYPENSGWHDLSSLNDVELLKSILSPSFSIQTLKDSEATKTGIKEAVLRLASTTAVGDTVLIHFSGHGQQMLTNDPNEPDSLDEAIVPYDALLYKTESYMGENHIRDNELGEWVNAIAKKAGDTGAVFVSIDACHSDDANRGPEDSTAIYRGRPEIFGAPQGFNPGASLYNVETSVIARGEGTANIIFLSACQTYQKNREYNGYGSLSYALSNTLKRQRIDITPQFLDSVCTELSKLNLSQTPGVRATFEYKVPTYEPPMEVVQDEDFGIPVWIWFVGGLLILIIIAVIWKTKKTRRNSQEGF